MPVNLRWGQCCASVGCLRPATELGHLCSACWRALAPAQRDLLKWEAAVEANGELDFDPVAEAEAILREAA